MCFPSTASAVVAVRRRWSRAAAFPLLVVALVLCVVGASMVPLRASGALVGTVTIVQNTAPIGRQLMQSALAAYAVQRPDLTLTDVDVRSWEGIANLYGVPPSADYLVLGARMPEDNFDPSIVPLITANTDITSFPVAAGALVPVYNLPEVSVPLLLSRQVLSQIFRGAIRYWNDSALAALNPALALPPHPITVVLPPVGDQSAQTFLFMQAMSKFEGSAWTDVMGPSKDSWPDVSSIPYAAVERVGDLTGPASLVNSVPYSISYSTGTVARDLGSQQALMVNKAGQVVEVTPETISYAFLELGVYTDPTTKTPKWRTDLTDGAGMEAWPLAYGIGCFLPKTFSRTTCKAREEIVDMWNWFLGSSVILSLAASMQITLLPPLLYSAMDMGTFLRQGITCDGRALDSTSSHNIVMGGAQLSTLVSDTNTLFLDYYSARDPDYVYVMTPMQQLQALQQTAAREIDAALIVTDQFDEIYPEELSQFLADRAGENALYSGDLLTLPLAVWGVAPIFNLPDSAAANYSGTLPLVITPDVLGAIFVGAIKHWDDPRIDELNPGLAAAFATSGTNTNITVVSCCSVATSPTPAGNALVQSLRATSNTFNSLARAWSLPVDWTLALQAVRAAGGNVLQVSVEQQLEAAVQRIPGAIGYKLISEDEEDPDIEGMGIHNLRDSKFALLGFHYNHASAADAANVMAASAEHGVPLHFSPEALESCTIASPPHIGSRYTLMNLPATDKDTSADVARCWPMNILGTVLVPNWFTGTDSCTQGNHTLMAMQWLLTEPMLNLIADKRGVYRLATDPTHKTLVNNALNLVDCDGETLLVTLPRIWHLGNGVTVFSYAMEALGFVLVLVTGAILWKYRHRVVLRSSSVPFQFVILAGMAMLFSTLGNVGTYPTAGACQAMAWQINLGFTLMFAPLLLKMWRIYQIFDRRVLKVVKISNQKLGAMLLALLGVDIVVNAAWQIVAPPEASMSTVDEGGRPHSYMMCTGPPGAIPFLVVIVVEKIVFLLFGCYMGFVTRNVASTFNESKLVAWAIYNVFFSVAVLVPILFFSGATSRGDPYHVLIIVLLFWISAATWALNFGNKFRLLMRGEGRDANNSVSAGGSAVTGDVIDDGANAALFSFPSLGALSRSVLDKYIAALETQMKLARSRHSMLLAENGGGVPNQFASAGYGPGASYNGGSRMPHKRAESRDRGANRSRQLSGNFSGLNQRRGGVGGFSLDGGVTPLAPPNASGLGNSGPADAYRVTHEDELEPSRSSRRGGWTNEPNTPVQRGMGGGASAQQSRAAVKLSSRAAKGVLSLDGSEGGVEMVQTGGARGTAGHSRADSRADSGQPVLLHYDASDVTPSGPQVQVAPRGAASQYPSPLPASSEPQEQPEWMDDLDADGTQQRLHQQQLQEEQEQEVRRQQQQDEQERLRQEHDRMVRAEEQGGLMGPVDLNELDED